MNSLKNLKVGTRLGAGFGVCLALLAVVAVSAFIMMTRLRDEITLITDDRVVKVVELQQTQDQINAILAYAAAEGFFNVSQLVGR